jgi:hypothetical protein
MHIDAYLQLENSLLELLVDNLIRLNETEESDRQGVFHVLGKIPIFPATRARCNN